MVQKKSDHRDSRQHWLSHDPDLKVGQTPKTVIWRKNKATLWYYPARKKTFNTPLFLVYSLINQSYILDLYPGMSMIEAFGHEGYDVYLLDFGIPGQEDADLTLDDYLINYIQRAVRRAIHHSDSEEITIIGYCLGGTLAAIYAALTKQPIKNLVLFATPIDFEHVPLSKNWTNELKRNKPLIEEWIDEFGVIPKDVMHVVMRIWISPFTYSSYLSLLEKRNDERAVRKWRLFNRWIKGHIPFAGAAFKQLLFDVAMENKLVRNKLIMNQQLVDLKKINSNVLILATTHDQIVPERLTKPLIHLIASEDKTYQQIAGGHVTIAMTGSIPTVLKEWLAKRC